jgi:TonB family protein
MNRLQKKCAIATVGIHLLLLIILFVGPAFFNREPKVDNTTVLDVIPANLVDAAVNSGVRNATPPPPAPVVTPQPPTPVAPAPIVQPAPPPPEPKPVVTEPTLAERIEKIFKSEPVKSAPEKTETTKHTIEISTQLVSRAEQPASTSTLNSHRAAKTLSTTIKNLEKNFTPGTTIDMRGDNSVASANYASVVKSIYDRAWELPAAVKDENIIVSVTIASDGTVITSRIINPSGDEPADESVQRTLDRVTYIAPFPEGTTDKQRTYTINFNPRIKQESE